MSGVGSTVASVLSSVIVAGLTLVYWELRSRGARARQTALGEQVAQNGSKLDALTESTPATPTRGQGEVSP